MCKALSFRITGKQYNFSSRAKALDCEVSTEKSKATILQSQKMLCHIPSPEGYQGTGLGQTCSAMVLVFEGCDSQSAAPWCLNGWNRVNGSDQPEVQ